MQHTHTHTHTHTYTYIYMYIHIYITHTHTNTHTHTHIDRLDGHLSSSRQEWLLSYRESEVPSVYRGIEVQGRSSLSLHSLERAKFSLICDFRRLVRVDPLRQIKMLFLRCSRPLEMFFLRCSTPKIEMLFLRCSTPRASKKEHLNLALTEVPTECNLCPLDLSNRIFMGTIAIPSA